MTKSDFIRLSPGKYLNSNSETFYYSIWGFKIQNNISQNNKEQNKTESLILSEQSVVEIVSDNLVVEEGYLFEESTLIQYFLKPNDFRSKHYTIGEKLFVMNLTDDDIYILNSSFPQEESKVSIKTFLMSEFVGVLYKNYEITSQSKGLQIPPDLFWQEAEGKDWLDNNYTSFIERKKHGKVNSSIFKGIYPLELTVVNSEIIIDYPVELKKYTLDICDWCIEDLKVKFEDNKWKVY